MGGPVQCLVKLMIEHSKVTVSEMLYTVAIKLGVPNDL